jgi:hypothetical protein
MNPTALNRATRYAHVWLPGYVRDRLARWQSAPPKRVWVLFTDHYEPGWSGASPDCALARVRSWSERWPEIAARHQDSAGRPPRYTFFYAEEQYRPELLDPLAEMTEAGIADVEVHLHHDGEGERDFVDRIATFTGRLRRRHGLLRLHNGRVAFGFIHGDWALDNSGPAGRHCGLNNELILLRDLGCYADFTFPSVPHPSQPRLVNTIYWATDDPAQPKSYDSGDAAMPGGKFAGDLLIVPGPLALSFRGGRLLPRIETGELAAHNRIAPERVRLCLGAAPRIGDDVFLKFFAHGAPEHNAKALLDRDLGVVLQEVEHLSRTRGFELRYASAWEMRQAIDAAVEKTPQPAEDCPCAL